MAILRKKEIQKMSEDDLNSKLYELRLELMKKRGDVEIGTIKNPGQIKEIRKTIARILTIKRKKKEEKK